VLATCRVGDRIPAKFHYDSHHEFHTQETRQMSTEPDAGTNLSRAQLANLIEQHGAEVLGVVLAALRSDSPASVPNSALVSAKTVAAGGATASYGRVAPWQEADAIEDFVAVWPPPEAWRQMGHSTLREAYGAMAVYRTTDNRGDAQIALGDPGVRLPLYGRERGWLSTWEVRNERPVRQLANFVEVDDFETTRERAALISGKDGAPKKGYAPGEEHLLPAIYQGMRIEIQRDRLVGPNARNRLVVIATDGDVTTMLDHALGHLRLRS
jgi:hypothetical protein